MSSEKKNQWRNWQNIPTFRLFCRCSLESCFLRKQVKPGRWSVDGLSAQLDNWLGPGRAHAHLRRDNLRGIGLESMLLS